MFSEKLAQVDSQCISDMQMGNQNSPFCIDEEFRTVNGGGDFDPFDTSEGRIRALFKSHHERIERLVRFEQSTLSKFDHCALPL